VSNWQNDNWNGNDFRTTYPVEVIPRPIRRAMRFSFRLYLLVVCVGAFLWATYAGVQAIRKLSSDTHTSQPAPQHHHPHSMEGQRP
jgi:hypothetical protein